VKHSKLESRLPTTPTTRQRSDKIGIRAVTTRLFTLLSLLGSMLAASSSMAIAQEIPRDFSVLSSRDLTLACEVHTTYLATGSAQSADPRTTAQNLVLLALVWKRASAYARASDAEMRDWRRRTDALSAGQIREQATYCITQAQKIFLAFPDVTQRELRDEAVHQTNRLSSGVRN
jgi:hypothetical protein